MLGCGMRVGVRCGPPAPLKQFSAPGIHRQPARLACRRPVPRAHSTLGIPIRQIICSMRVRRGTARAECGCLREAIFFARRPGGPEESVMPLVRIRQQRLCQRGVSSRVPRPRLFLRGVPRRTPRLNLARIRRQLPAADADALALRGRAPSSRFDVLSSTPASSSGPGDQAGRCLDALTTKVGDGCGLALRGVPLRAARLMALVSAAGSW